MILTGSNLHGFIPAKFVVYTDLLRNAGYFVGLTSKDYRAVPELEYLQGALPARVCQRAAVCAIAGGGVTGRYQQRFGVEENGKGPLPLAELTLAERLKPAGYVSCQVGKWHLDDLGKRGAAGGNGHTFQPCEQGFDEYFTGSMNSFIASHDLAGNKLPDAPRTLKDRRFRCVWQSEAALSFIGRHARDPFFLYLAYFTPHVPLESPEPWFSKTPAALPCPAARRWQ